MKRWFLSFVFVFALVLANSRANAQQPPAPDDAKTEAAKASKAFDARNYRAAAEGYEAAFAKSPTGFAWLFQSARARKGNGDLAKAANAYARFVSEAPATEGNNKHLHATAKKELAALTPKLGRLEIKAAGATKVTVDGEPVDLAISPTIYVNADAHLVEAHFGDETVKESTTTPMGQVTSVVLARPAGSATTTATTTTTPEAEAPTNTPASVISHEPRERPVPPIAIWIGAGATGVLGGVSIISGLDVLSQKDTFDADRSQENLDSGKDKQVRTNILLVATGVVAVATAVAAIWFVDWSRARDRKSTAPSAAKLLLLHGRF